MPLLDIGGYPEAVTLSTSDKQNHWSRVEIALRY